MPKWEYAHKVMPTNHEEVVKQLNELGHDGWELIDADPVNGLFSVFLKREYVEPPKNDDVAKTDAIENKAFISGLASVPEKV